MLVYVQDINLIIKNLILLLLRESLDILVVLLIMEFWYFKDTNISLAGFSDADWAGNADIRKSTSGGCFYLGNNLVSWNRKKKNSISLSTAEAKYIALGSFAHSYCG